MESTGVYWKPIWQVLDGQFTLVLANARHVRNIPGRKSDVNDATWIADLLAHGLIRGSFVPPAPVQELRDLTRIRKQLVREITQHTLRIQKTLETANLKLTGLLSNILGLSGRAILHALVAGETDPERLADLVHGGLKASRAALVAALHGRLTAHHRFLLQLHLTQVDALEQAVHDVEGRLGHALVPFRAALDRLITMPGVSETVARVVVAEIGFDMTQLRACRKVCAALTTPRSKPRTALQAELRLRWILVLAPGTLHAGGSSRPDCRRTVGRE